MKADLILVSLLVAVTGTFASDCNRLRTYTEQFEATCQGAETTVRWPNYEDLTSFVVCVDGQPMVESCASGTYFTFVMQQCTTCDDYIPAPPCDQLRTLSPPICTPFNSTGGGGNGGSPTPSVPSPGLPTLPTPRYPTGATEPDTAGTDGGVITDATTAAPTAPQPDTAGTENDVITKATTQPDTAGTDGGVMTDATTAAPTAPQPDTAGTENDVITESTAAPAIMPPVVATNPPDVPMPPTPLPLPPNIDETPPVAS